jgi:hypothetical protein
MTQKQLEHGPLGLQNTQSELYGSFNNQLPHCPLCTTYIMKLTFDEKCACFRAQSTQLIERLVIKAKKAGLTVGLETKRVSAKKHTLRYIVSGQIHLSVDMSLVSYRSARQDINTKIKDKLIENLAKEIAYATKHRSDSREILEKATIRAKRYGHF